MKLKWPLGPQGLWVVLALAVGIVGLSAWILLSGKESSDRNDTVMALAREPYSKSDLPDGFEIVGTHSYRATGASADQGALGLVYTSVNGPDDFDRIAYEIFDTPKRAMTVFHGFVRQERHGRSDSQNAFRLRKFAYPSLCVSSRTIGIQCSAVVDNALIRGDARNRSPGMATGSVRHSKALLETGIAHWKLAGS